MIAAVQIFIVSVVDVDVIVICTVAVRFFITVRFGQLIQHQILVLLLPPDVVRQPRICIVDAHRTSEVPLGVLDALELVDTQLQDPLAHLTHPQLGRDHWHLWPVAPNRWRGVWWSKHIRIVFSNVGGVVAR